MKTNRYYQHVNCTNTKLKRLEPETTAPQPDKYLCPDCGAGYVEVAGSASDSGPRLVQYAFPVKSTDGAS